MIIALLGSAVFAASLNAATALQNYVELKNWGKGMKESWLTYDRDFHNDKYNLLIEHHDQWFDHGIATLKKLEGEKTEAQKQAIFQNAEQDAVNILNKQSNDWKQLCDKYHDKAVKQGEKYQKELQDLARKANVKLMEIQPLQNKLKTSTLLDV